MDRALDLGLDRDVVDPAAAATDEVVVVVAGDVLGQLEPGDVVRTGQSSHDTGLFEHREVPVQRGL